MTNQELIQQCLNNSVSKITSDSGRYYEPSLNLSTNAMRLVKEIKRLFNNAIHSFSFAFKGSLPSNIKASLSQLLKSAWVAVKKIVTFKVNHFEERAKYLNWYYNTLIDNASFNIMRAAEKIKADNSSNSPPTEAQYNDTLVFAKKVEAFKNQRYGTNE